jgi:hypothetical protein
VLATWVAGAGASGVLSARGGDALRVLLLRRRMRTTCPTLVGTLAAETVAETALGAAFTAWALGAGLLPGFHDPDLATGAAVVGGVLALWLVLRRAARRFPALAKAGADARQGLRLLGSPRAYLRRVVPWGLLSRALRLGALACFLAAFGLAVSLTAVLVVMVAHSGGRLVPFGPAGAGASLALLVAALPAVTGAGAGQVTAFYLGMTGVLTAVGLGLSALILVHALGLGGARRALAEALERVPRRAPARVPAA